MGAGNLKDRDAAPVSVDVVFDRFPASVRGAVVVRGLDSEPHQIRIIGAEVVEAHDPRRGVHPVAVDAATVDVAPRREVLVPFDVPFAELPPGWYCVVADVQVDGSLRLRGPQGGGKRFGVPWPPEEVRRVDLKPNLKLGAAVIERIQSKTDRTEIRWHLTGAETAALKVSAGSRRLPLVETVDDPKTAGRISVAHPIPKKAEQLTFELIGKDRRKASATLDLA